MKSQKGFTLIELLIVVAIIGIIAAIAIPSLVRARTSANEAGTIGDIRTVISASAAYQSSTPSRQGYAPRLSCLSTPSGAGCLPNYPPTAPKFVDALIGSGAAKSGYGRSYTPGVVLPSPTAAGEVDAYCYLATASTQNRTGLRSFGGDSSGVIGETATGPIACCLAAALNTVACPAMK